MIHCSKSVNAELVIVSRDSDFGATFDNKLYVNDHLRQEFSERVSKRRKLLLYSRLSDALKHFQVPITEKEVQAEAEIVEAKVVPISGSAVISLDWLRMVGALRMKEPDPEPGAQSE